MADLMRISDIQIHCTVTLHFSFLFFFHKNLLVSTPCFVVDVVHGTDFSLSFPVHSGCFNLMISN